jgi:hypothetical protein
MSVDVTQLVMDRYYINELQDKISREHKELYDRWELLRKRCSHPTIRIDREYNRGGYDYVSSVTITHKCTICDKVLKSYDDPNHKGSHG